MTKVWRVKPEQRVKVGDAEIFVSKIGRQEVTININAPKDVKIEVEHEPKPRPAGTTPK